MVRAFPWARVVFALSLAGAAGAGALAVRGLVGGGPGAPGWLVAASAAGLASSIAAGVFLLSAGLFARPILAASPARAAGRVALTFDDGPDAEHTRRVLDRLESRGHRGTFFVIGRRAAESPALVREIVRRGHGLANHTWAHARLSAMLPPARLAEDLARAQALLAEHGVRSRFFRPVAGVLSPRVTAAARLAGLELVGWSASGRDGVRTTVEAAAGRLRRGLRPGAILVLHDGADRADRTPIAADVLDRVLDDLDARGLRSVTLDELLVDARD